MSKRQYVQMETDTQLVASSPFFLKQQTLRQTLLLHKRPLVRAKQGVAYISWAWSQRPFVWTCVRYFLLCLKTDSYSWTVAALKYLLINRACFYLHIHPCFALPLSFSASNAPRVDEIHFMPQMDK